MVKEYLNHVLFSLNIMFFCTQSIAKKMITMNVKEKSRVKDFNSNTEHVRNIKQINITGLFVFFIFVLIYLSMA